MAQSSNIPQLDSGVHACLCQCLSVCMCVYGWSSNIPQLDSGVHACLCQCLSVCMCVYGWLGVCEVAEAAGW